MSATSLRILDSCDETRIRELIESVERQTLHDPLHPAPGLYWENLTVTLRGEYACCSGFLRVTRSLTAQNAKAGRATSLWRVATIRLERTHGAWHIMHASFRAVSNPREFIPAVLHAARAQDALPTGSPLFPAPRPASCVPCLGLRP
jgi:hypothetical protein